MARYKNNFRTMRPAEIATIVAHLKEVCGPVEVDGVTYAEYTPPWSDGAVAKALAETIQGINPQHVHRVRIDMFGKMKPKPKPEPAPRKTRSIYGDAPIEELEHPKREPQPFGIWMSLLTPKGHEGSSRVFVDLAEVDGKYVNKYPVAIRYFMLGSSPAICLFKHQNGGDRLYTFNPISVTYSNSCMLVDAGYLSFASNVI